MRLENRKQRKKFNQLIKPPSLKNTKFSDINDSNNNFELGWYWFDSSNTSDKEYSGFSEEKEGDKRDESDRSKSIILPSPLALRPAKLSWNKVGKAKLSGYWSKILLSTEKTKREMQGNINIRPYKVTILMICLPN